MSIFIGRKFNIGLGKESTRGTSVAATYWYPKTDFSVEDKIATAVHDGSYGVIEDADTQEIVQKYAEASLGGRITDIGFGLILGATLGTDTIGAVESGVKDHVFTLLESAQHPSLSVVVSEPNALSSAALRYPLGMISSLEINFAVGQWATYKTALTMNTPSTASATPSFTAENAFNPQYCVAKFAPTYAGVNGTLTATGTAASTIHVTACSINPQTLLQVGMTVTGTNIPAGATVAVIVSATAFDLSVASTGAIGTMTFGGATVNVRSAQIVISKNIEDDTTIGSLSAVDRYNKQFSITGSMVLVYNDRSYIDTIMLGDLVKAIRLIAVNTGVTIGATSSPTITIDLARAKIMEVARTDKNNDVMLQTIKFKAYYSISDTLMTQITLRDTVTTAFV